MRRPPIDRLHFGASTVTPRGSTSALGMTGITRSTPDPVGGRIERDADGNATGVLVDKAMNLVERIVPQPTDAERRVALRSPLRTCTPSV